MLPKSKELLIFTLLNLKKKNTEKQCPPLSEVLRYSFDFLVPNINAQIVPAVVAHYFPVLHEDAARN